MHIIYYYIFLFFKKILRDDTPHFLTTIFFSFLQSCILNAFFNFSFAYAFCYSFSMWNSLSIVLLLIIINFIYFHNEKKLAFEIINKKPKILNSKLLPVIITILFFISTQIIFMYSSDVTKEILNNCK